MQSGNDVHKNQRDLNLFYCKIAMIAFVDTFVDTFVNTTACPLLNLKKIMVDLRRILLISHARTAHRLWVPSTHQRRSNFLIATRRSIYFPRNLGAGITNLAHTLRFIGRKIVTASLKPTVNLVPLVMQLVKLFGKSHASITYHHLPQPTLPSQDLRVKDH